MTPVDRRHAIGQRHPGFNLTDQPYRPAAELPGAGFCKTVCLEKCLLKKVLPPRRAATRVSLTDA
jgi:hypothetical protein